MSHYSTLEVEQNASTDDIRRAYRSLSMKYHPDRPTGNGEKYKKITHAYDILGDVDKRKQYDIEERFQSSGGGSVNIPDIFNMMFGGSGGVRMSSNPHQTRVHMHNSGIPINIDELFGGFHGPNVKIYQNGRQVIEPIEKRINITLAEAYQGTKKGLVVKRWIVHNNQKKEEHETIYIDIPRGIDDGEMILLKNKGNQSLDSNISGDVKLSISIEQHHELERKGIHLHFKKKISFKESLCGFKFNISHIDGKQYSINNQPGKVIHPQFRKIVPNLGMNRDGMTGNLIIEFDVDYPKTLSDDCVATLDEIL